MFDGAWKFHISMLGFAIFMAISAVQTWGGVFPFLPQDFQTNQVTLLFYLSQSVAFFAAFAFSAWGCYFMPRAARRMLVGGVTALLFLGSAAIIAAMYIPGFTLELILVGGVLLGVGNAGMFMLWQRYFSSVSSIEGNFRLVTGSALAAPVYFALYLIPTALTAFLVPVVFLPLCSLALTFAVREMDFAQPMFEDVPRDHPAVYMRVIKDSWRSAVAVAAIAFSSGLARGVAVLDMNVAQVVNITSMLGSFIAAVAILIAWRRASFSFSMSSVFKYAYPVLITGLLFFPFMQNILGLNLFAGLTYTMFSLITLVLMMQCAQISRDRGINPVFAYGFFGAIAYGVQSLGFLLGWLLYDNAIGGLGQAGFLSLLAIYMLGMALFLAGRAIFKPSPELDQIELIRSPMHEAATEGAIGLALEESEDGGPVTHSAADGGGVSGNDAQKSDDFEDAVITDRLSKQCFMLRKQYGLSAREAEVMEHIARGLSMASIAETLFISENTVRTHAKHIYTKLDIHSRQELGELLKTTSSFE